MPEEGLLQGRRILIVEDEFFLADELSNALRGAGAEPVGPVGSTTLAEGELAARRIDAAIIDLNLHGTLVFDFAERLSGSGVPCLIVSGYSREALPDAVAGLPRLEKPVDSRKVIEALADQLGTREATR
jgi:DNA-binding NtrC family response regulator